MDLRGRVILRGTAEIKAAGMNYSLEVGQFLFVEDTAGGRVNLKTEQGSVQLEEGLREEKREDRKKRKSRSEKKWWVLAQPPYSPQGNGREPREPVSSKVGKTRDTAGVF